MADAGYAVNLLWWGAFAVCRHWNEVLKREPACWWHLVLHNVSDDLIRRVLAFTRSCRYFRHLHLDGGQVTDAGIEVLS